MDYRTYLKKTPDENGYYGPYGGSFIPNELIRKEYQGRPTPVYLCERLSHKL